LPVRNATIASTSVVTACPSVSSDARSTNARQRSYQSVVVRVSEQTRPGGTRKDANLEHSERHRACTVEES